MDKRIGKIAFFFAFWGCVSHASVSLIVKDRYGKHLQEAALGIPFTVEIHVVDGPNTNPQVEFPSEFLVVNKSSSTSYRSINGKTSSSRTYSYTIRCDREGSFTVGPARVPVGINNTLLSNTVDVRVSHDNVQQELQRPFFFDLSVRPEKMYIGQQAHCTIRFYYAIDSVRLEGIEEPAFPDCYTTKLQGPFSGVEKKDGIDYKYLEWRTIVSPKKTGQLTVPAVTGHVAVAPTGAGQHSFADMLSLVDAMFGGAGRVERHYSNSLSLEVMPLPKHDDPVHGVGTFSSYTAKVNTKQGSVGEGVVYTLELVGVGNTQSMIHPILELPESMKYYDSHAKEVMLSDVIKKKDFEYILQAVEPGEYVIPQQTFTFFDPQLKRYKTLSSNSVTVIITGSVQKKESDQKDLLQEEEKPLSEDESHLAPVYKASWRAGMPCKYLSWVWYFLLLAGSVMIVIAHFMIKRVQRYRARNHAHYIARNAFKNAYQRLSLVEIGHNAAPLYGIVKRLFAERLGVSESTVSQEYIETVLRGRGMNDEEIHEWNTFFNYLAELHFTTVASVTRTLQGQMTTWLKRFEKVLV